jgi:hypothetical protein
MVSVTLIVEAFEDVAKGPFLIIERLLGNYTFCLISPWWLTWFPSKWVTLGEMVSTGGLSLKGHHTIATHTYHFPCLFLFVSSSFGFFGSLTPRRACSSFHGKKRLKDHRCCSWKESKFIINPSIFSP